MKTWLIPIIGGVFMGCLVGWAAWYDTNRLDNCVSYHYETRYRGFPPASWEQKVCDK